VIDDAQSDLLDDALYLLAMIARRPGGGIPQPDAALRIERFFADHGVSGDVMDKVIERRRKKARAK
jgi:heptaprenylglyceryl phosphate synthase